MRSILTRCTSIRCIAKGQWKCRLRVLRLARVLPVAAVALRLVRGLPVAAVELRLARGLPVAAVELRLARVLPVAAVELRLARVLPVAAVALVRVSAALKVRRWSLTSMVFQNPSSKSECAFPPARMCLIPTWNTSLRVSRGRWSRGSYTMTLTMTMTRTL